MNVGRKGKSDDIKKDKKGPEVVWCREYNQGTCSHTASHEGKFFGQTVKKLHICSTCLKRENKKLAHKASDAVCPHVE